MQVRMFLKSNFIKDLTDWLISCLISFLRSLINFFHFWVAGLRIEKLNSYLMIIKLFFLNVFRHFQACLHTNCKKNSKVQRQISSAIRSLLYLY